MTGRATTQRWSAQGLRAGYHGTAVLHDIDLDLEPGAVVAVVGGDGAGKTTLLRCLAGAMPTMSGHLRLPPPAHIGSVSEGPGIYHDLTVAENLEFAGRAYGVDQRTRTGRMAELLEATGLATAADRLAANLSGGMRQKLAFAAATMHRPALLLLDEATTGVDPVSRRDLFRLLARSAAEGTAVVLSTSYLDEAERAATVLVLHEGHQLLTGPAPSVIAQMPGTLHEVSVRPDGPLSRTAWRHGPRWRVWCPPGQLAPSDATAAAPHLEDAVLVALLQRTGAADQVATAEVRSR